MEIRAQPRPPLQTPVTPSDILGLLHNHLPPSPEDRGPEMGHLQQTPLPQGWTQAYLRVWRWAAPVPSSLCPSPPPIRTQVPWDGSITDSFDLHLVRGHLQTDPAELRARLQQEPEGHVQGGLGAGLAEDMWVNHVATCRHW